MFAIFIRAVLVASHFEVAMLRTRKGDCSPLPCRRSILLRRSASLHRSRTAAPGRARGLVLLRNRQRCLRGLSFIFFFLSGFSFFPCFSSFSSRHLVFVPKKNKIIMYAINVSEYLWENPQFPSIFEF